MTVAQSLAQRITPLLADVVASQHERVQTSRHRAPLRQGLGAGVPDLVVGQINLGQTVIDGLQSGHDDRHVLVFEAQIKHARVVAWGNQAQQLPRGHVQRLLDQNIALAARRLHVCPVHLHQGSICDGGCLVLLLFTTLLLRVILLHRPVHTGLRKLLRWQRLLRPTRVFGGRLASDGPHAEELHHVHNTTFAGGLDSLHSRLR
mmetsp:Transcript_12417/g.29587  ORF Transcript_12417/g.29587 Transcript_12417/m.29587 type:complete len:204 (-) Transcript_12417:297-908(-)